MRSADDNADVKEQTQETYITQLFFAQFPPRWRRLFTRLCFAFFSFFFLIPFLTNFGQDKSLFNAHLQKDPRFARKMHGKNSHLFRDFWEENAFIVWCCLWNSCLNRKICFIVGIRARWKHVKNAHKYKKECKLLKIMLCEFFYLRTPHACVKKIKN